MTPARALAAAVAVAAAGVYLRRGVTPVVVAFHVGRDAERLFSGPARAAHVFRMAYDIGRRDRLTARRGAR